MKIYFEETNGNNLVVMTNGEAAKVFDGAPSGTFENVDLYAENAAEELIKRFKALDQAGELNNYQDIHSDNEMAYEDIKEELEECGVLIFECK